MKLAVIVSHPIQYYSPWFRHIADAMRHEAIGNRREGVEEDQKTERQKDEETTGIQRPEVGSRRSEDGGRDSQQNALRVFYLWDFGVTEKTDKGFGKAVKWDVDLLEDYDHEFVANVSPDPGTHWFGGLDNPELLERVKVFAPDAVLQFGYNYKSLLNFDLRWKTRRAPLLFRGDSHLLAEGEQGIRHEAYGIRVKRWVRQIGLRLLFKRFACFLAVGKANADYFRAHGVRESKIVRCPHVVDNAFFLDKKNASGQPSVGSVQPEQRSTGLRAELGIPEDELVFLFAGKLEEKKQPLLLLEAYLAADLPKATLVFVGSGELERELKERALGAYGIRRTAYGQEAVETEELSRAKRTEDGPKANSVSPADAGRGQILKHGKTEPPVAGDPARRVVFLEFQNQSVMPDVYRTGDVLVLPSNGRYETWGLAVNEAACCGLPAIVSSHVGCGPDLIEDGVTGWIFEAGKVASLQWALEKAAANRERLVAMGETLKQRVTREYSYQSATEALLKGLRQTADGRR